MRCTIEGCTRDFRARGFCSTHYRRWQVHGDPHVVLRRRYPSPEERFWSMVEKADGCWLWTGSRSGSGDYGAGGYGQMSIDGRPARAHRFAYELLVGPIPDGMLVCHRCDTPPCVNPEHLFLGDKKANADDMVRKGRGRNLRGDDHPARSPERRARHAEILKLHAEGMTNVQIAKKVGISATSVSLHICGKRFY